MPALLIGGELDGQRVPVRLGLNGLPRYLDFPKLISKFPNIAFEVNEYPEYGVSPAAPAFSVIRYVLYDDVPAKYLHENEWGGGDGPDDGPDDVTPTPTPGILTC